MTVTAACADYATTLLCTSRTSCTTRHSGSIKAKSAHGMTHCQNRGKQTELQGSALVVSRCLTSQRSQRNDGISQSPMHFYATCASKKAKQRRSQNPRQSDAPIVSGCLKSQHTHLIDGTNQSQMHSFANRACRRQRERLYTTGASLHNGSEFAQREQVCTSTWTNMVTDTNSGQAKKEIISGFPCHYLSREIVLCYDSCYIFLYMEHVMVHVSCSAGRCGSCIYARRRVRAPGATGLLTVIEQGCATRGGWRTTQ